MKIFKQRNILILSSLFAVLSFSSCGDDDEVESEEVASGWSETQKTAFILGCTIGDPSDPDNNGSSEEQCECFFEKVSASYTAEEVENATIEDGLAIGLLSLGCL